MRKKLHNQVLLCVCNVAMFEKATGLPDLGRDDLVFFPSTVDVRWCRRNNYICLQKHRVFSNADQECDKTNRPKAKGHICGLIVQKIKKMSKGVTRTWKFRFREHLRVAERIVNLKRRVARQTVWSVALRFISMWITQSTACVFSNHMPQRKLYIFQLVMRT